jgi:hypothetical protein
MRRFTRRAIITGAAASIRSPAIAFRLRGGGFPGSGALLSVSNPTNPNTGQPVTRPLGAIWSSPNANDYPFASFTAVVNNPSATVNDYLTIAASSSPTSPITSPWYLNNSASPPGTIINNATVEVLSVNGSLWATSSHGSISPA